MAGTHQEVMKMFITHVMILPAENRAGPKQVWESREGKQDCVSFEIRVGVKVSMHGLNFPSVAKEETIWLCRKSKYEAEGEKGRDDI